MKKINVLIVDDSPTYRAILRRLVSQFDEVAEVRTALDGLEALESMKTFAPQLVIVDLDMPRLGGVELTRVIRAKAAAADVVILSGVSGSAAELTWRALDAGALDFICKPNQASARENDALLTDRLAPFVALAASGDDRRRQRTRERGADGARPGVAPRVTRPLRTSLVVIGASTGAPNALVHLLPRLTTDLPVPIIVAVHMPAAFTQFIARHLRTKSSLEVVEAVDGERLAPGKVFIAPGESLTRVVRLKDERCGPAQGPLHLQVVAADPASYGSSVDVLLQSIAGSGASGCLAVIMTGMGRDGAEGVRSLKSVGGNYCIVQSEATCTIASMPRAVIASGLADEVVPLDGLGRRIVELAGS